MEVCLWNRARIQLGMRRWCGLVRETVVEIDRDSCGKCLAQIALRFQIIALPATFADKRRRDQDNRAEDSFRRILGESVDQYRSADGVTDEDCTIVQGYELILERRLPR